MTMLAEVIEKGAPHVGRTHEWGLICHDKSSLTSESNAARI
jgi:hypothetical protein